ncbi:TonB-dependent receptor [Saccharobesus litoralis]|uniref:TonB-dependent receptor n=1 Tax=Saccharobesus litoralis TaxID=2172099 RepID=A0A2S0VPE3_9ALTE|nr:TonB-dependent receptor [Saccharobesus litoralis]AWB66091.1 TonB-dependent receptor [Saccharobesus litoralis]
MTIKQPNTHIALFKKTTISACIALACTSAYANEQSSDDEVEVIEIVSSFRGNLESAINEKKMSPTIVDGISADDIGSLPALDMGEALQAVPGVQLNREGTRRESSINLRGLPSGFVATTANGQAMATPTRGTSPYGPGNPFGAYNPSVFNGISVQKSLTADMVEGGIAGTVNKKVKSPLQRKDSLRMQIGTRYEELADSMDPQVSIAASKQLIEGELAVSGTLAYSKQTFRQDVIKINAYETMKDSWFENGNQTFAEWKAANNLADDAIVQFPGEYRQQSEVTGGDRFSFSGGIEYKPNDNLTLGATTIITERNLDDSRLEQLEVRLDKGTSGITPVAQFGPRDTGTKGKDGQSIYVLSGIDFSDAGYYYDNRKDEQLQDAQAFMFDAKWEGEQWTFDGNLTLSDATNRRTEVLLSNRIDKVETGVDGSVYTGEGDIGAFYFNMTGTENAMDFDNAVWSPKMAVANTATVFSSAESANKLYMLITGNFEQIEHSKDSFSFNAKRDFDDGLISSIKFGYRFADSFQDSTYAKGSSIGIDPTGIMTSSKITDPSYVSEQHFFDGKADGFVTAAQGWRSFDFDSMSAALIGSININDIAPSSDGEVAEFTPTGYIKRGGRQADGFVYSSGLKTHALYGMANFEAELFGPTYLRGNVGGRYIQSETEAKAPLAGQGDINNLPVGVYTDDYNHFLPSVNLSANLDEDEKLIMRFAYNKNLARPDLRSASPTAKFKYIPGLATVDLPGTGIKPFEADSYDLSLEWYNREGSAITLAYFQKEISNLFDSVGICDSSALEGTGVNLGKLSEQADGTCITDGNHNLSDPSLLSAGDEVRMSGLVNLAETISVSGFELSIQQNLDFLPYPFNGLGGVLNYSKTSQDDDDESRIPGISDDTYNAIVYYEQESFGVRLAYNYRTAYDLRTTGTANGSGDRSVAAAGRLDASAYYKITKDAEISFKAYNLTESLYEEYQANDWMPRTTKYAGKVFTVGLKYNFF